MSRSFSRAFGLLLAPLILCGCPEPHTKFNEFVERATTNDAGVTTDGGTTGLHDVTGTFLLAISTTLAPDKPIQFITESVLTMNSDGTGTLNLMNQALTVVGRMPVGNIITSDNIPVASDGSFTAPFGTQTVPGSANPITNGDIVATITLVGATVSVDRMCGSVTGMVTSPIPLNLTGSTWGAIRVPAGTIGAALPPPDTTCPITATPTDGGASDGGVSDGGSHDGATHSDGAASGG